jgi:hypothetical protein
VLSCELFFIFLHFILAQGNCRKDLAQDWRTVQSQSFLLLLGGKLFIFFPLKSVVSWASVLGMRKGTQTYQRMSLQLSV